ncbi:transporter substrate-binding domain-containing protein [Moraxella osloensis]|uniref:transporter substrate-binding domain-containing protein n=1 Tax=Faucicola osloensis TaxID=34062 RepID=UPI0020038256|nr:transporter substrate-binding domain-containing protein [Moraxella osloensis]MCK6052270.1 transporter substrate-binding domain-containing protein [Moraxella osloensis]
MQSTLNSTYSKLALATVCAVSMGLTACQKPAEKTEGAAASQPAASASTGKKIRIATEGAYKPFNYTNADGTLGGYDVDVAKAVCAQAKLDCEIVAQDWDGILPGLMARKYDAVAAGMSITPERSAQVDFTTPYFKNTMVWVAAKDGKFNPQAISGLKIGAQRSTTMAQYLQDKLSKTNEIKLYDNYDNAYIDLKSGRIDSVLSEKVTASEWLKQNPNYQIVGSEMDNGDNIAMAIRKGDPLKAEFDKALGALQSNGELAKLQKQHFGN